MRTDENASAEFLFGKLASDYMTVKTPIKQFQMSSGYIKRFNLSLSLYLIVEFILGFAIIYSVLHLNQMMYVLVTTIAMRLIITAQKNKSLTDRFAPDLLQFSSTKLSFSLVQLLLSGLVFFGFGSLFFVLTGFIPALTIFDRSWVLLVALVLFYVNFISDLSIASLGKGVGVLGHSHKVHAFLSNIKELAKMKGRQSIPLAMIRLLNWGMIYYLITNTEMVTLLIPYVFLSIFYQFKWEKINSASLFMEIRGEITNGRPAVIPNKIFEDRSHNDLSNGSRSGSYLLNFVNRGSNGKYSHKSKNNNIRLNNLAPIAAKSLSRIAETIKHEENAIPSNMLDYCSNCSMEVIKASNFCAYCGERI